MVKGNEILRLGFNASRPVISLSISGGQGVKDVTKEIHCVNHKILQSLNKSQLHETESVMQCYDTPWET